MNKLVVVCATLLLASPNLITAFGPRSFGTQHRHHHYRRHPTTAIHTATVDNNKNNSNQEAYTIDESRRSTMNLLVLGSVAVTVGAIAIPYVAFFVPPTAHGAGGAVVAQDALGQNVVAADYLNTKPAGDRSLVLGLAGDATYLIVKDDKTLESFGLNAVCTHLGCVVPWSPAINKFQCPCHGSQYAPDGSVVRGPAPLPLALAHVNVDDESGNVVFTPWTETDFRTGERGWWM